MPARQAFCEGALPFKLRSSRHASDWIGLFSSTGCCTQVCDSPARKREVLRTRVVLWIHEDGRCASALQRRGLVCSRRSCSALDTP